MLSSKTAGFSLFKKLLLTFYGLVEYCWNVKVSFLAFIIYLYSVLFKLEIGFGIIGSFLY